MYRNRHWNAIAALFVVWISSSGLQSASGATPPNVVTNQAPPKNTLLLPNAFDQALSKNPRMSAVRFQLGISRASLRRATELSNPTIFMDNGYKAEDTYRYGFTVPIELPWKLAFRIALAKNQIKQTDLEIMRALWSFRAEVRKAYTERVIASELYDTYSELSQLTARLHAVAQKRYEAGEVAELDVLRTEQEKIRSEAQLIQQQYRVAETQQALSLILGQTPVFEFTVPRLPTAGHEAEAPGLVPITDQSKFPDLATCLQMAVKNRPEIKVVQQTIRTNKSSLKLAYANIIPNPIIGVGSSVVNGPAQPPKPVTPDSPPETPPKTKFRGFFFQVYQELPVFNMQQGDIAQFRATGRQLTWELAGQENLIAAEVATAYQRLLGARMKFEMYRDKLLNRTNEILRLSRLGYEVGHTDINVTLLAQQAAIQVKTEYLTTLGEYQQAFTDLERAIGTPLQ